MSDSYAALKLFIQSNNLDEVKKHLARNNVDLNRGFEVPMMGRFSYPQNVLSFCLAHYRSNGANLASADIFDYFLNLTNEQGSFVVDPNYVLPGDAGYSDRTIMDQVLRVSSNKLRIALLEKLFASQNRDGSMRVNLGIGLEASFRWLCQAICSNHPATMQLLLGLRDPIHGTAVFDPNMVHNGQTLMNYVQGGVATARQPNPEMVQVIQAARSGAERAMSWIQGAMGNRLHHEGNRHPISQ